MRIFLPLCLIAGPAFADAPEITDVKIINGTAHVTLMHPDTGWEHYADGWEILDMDGQSLGYRKLHHPHVNEQPFTRSLSGIKLPDGASQIQVRSHCNVSGWSDAIIVDLTN